MKYILLLVTSYVFGMREEKTSLPTLSNLESLKEYALTESYKGFLWTTGAASLIAVSSYGLKKFPQLVDRLPLLQKSSLKNSKIIGGFALASYILPQIINFKRYRHLATTPDMNDFKIKNRKEKDLSYTKYYFRPNPLKVLISRLVKIDTKEIYENIITTLSQSNLEELFSYLDSLDVKKNSKLNTIIDNLKNAIEGSLKLKIDSLTEDTTADEWATIFDLLSKAKKEKLKDWCSTIKNKIKEFKQNFIIETWLLVANNYKDYLELIERDYKLIREIDQTLATNFSDTCLDRIIEELNEDSLKDFRWINKFAFIFSYLDKKNIDENIKKVQSLNLLKNENSKKLLEYFYYARWFIEYRDKHFDHLFLFNTYFGLDVVCKYTEISNIERDKIFFYSLLTILIIRLKKSDEGCFNELITEHKDRLRSYINDYPYLKNYNDLTYMLKELNILDIESVATTKH